MKYIYILLFALLVSESKAIAQFSASLSGYPLVTTGWTVGGTATTIDSTIRLTTTSTSQSGYVYYGTPINLTSCSEFTVDFDFRVQVSSASTPADGIAFWYITTPPVGFTPGGGIGLPTYPTGIVLIMDTYDNDGNFNNPLETLMSYTGTAVGYTEGSAVGRLGSVVPSQSFITNGLWHHCRLFYSAGNISVYYDYSTTASITATYPLSMTGYFGFSASTGAAYSTQSIKNVHITSLTAPSAPLAADTVVNYCQYATATALSATGPGTITWYGDTTTTSALAAAPTPNTSVVGNTMYYVRQVVGGCMSSYDSVSVNVYANPAMPDITGITSYCQGETFVPFSVTGTGTTWYTSATGGTGSVTAPVVPTSTPGVYTYYAAASSGPSGMCQSARDSITVAVHPTPLAPTLLTGQSVYCQFDTFVPFTVSGTNVRWYTVPTGGTASSTPPVINTSVAGTYNYYVSQTDSGCESPRLHVPVVVNAKPAIPGVSPLAICQYATAAPLTASGVALTWYGPGVTTPYTTAPTPDVTTVTTLNYYVTQTIAGCTSDSANLPVTIKPKPIAPAATDVEYCQYSTSLPLTATGSNLLWYVAPTGGVGVSAAPVPTTGTPGVATWYVSQTILGCESDRSPLNVNTIFVPAFNIAATKFNVCQYDTLSLRYNSLSTATFYTWTLPSGTVYTSGTTMNSAAVTGIFSGASGPQQVILTVSGVTGICSASDTVIVDVVPEPHAIPLLPEGVCLGDTILVGLVDRTPNADDFTWSSDGGPWASSSTMEMVTNNSNSSGPYKIRYLTTGLHFIKLITSSKEGCFSRPVLDTVRVNDVPSSDFIYRSLTGKLCLEDSLEFIANVNDNGYFYQWSPNQYFGITNVESTFGRPSIENAKVSLTVTDGFGCYSTTTKAIPVQSCCRISMPNAFAPQGKNKLFRPVFEGFHRFHVFRVANRWGQTVFETTNNDVAWDGTFGGEPQDMGVYFYYIKYDCGGETFEETGDVTLVR